MTRPRAAECSGQAFCTHLLLACVCRPTRSVGPLSAQGRAETCTPQPGSLLPPVLSETLQSETPSLRK